MIMTVSGPDHCFPNFFMPTSLRKHAHAINSDFYSNKNENFQQKKIDVFLIFAPNIDCGYTLHAWETVNLYTAGAPL